MGEKLIVGHTLGITERQLAELKTRSDLQLAELEARAANEAAVAAQGDCPVHRTPMHPVDFEDADRVAGRCRNCGKYWWYDLRTGRIGSVSDEDPRTGSLIPPWMAGRDTA